MKEAPKDNFGVPRVSYDPIETLHMEGALFRNISDPKREKSLFVRIMSIFISTFWLLFPGLAILSVSLYEIVGFISSGFVSKDDVDFYAYILGFPVLAGCGVLLILLALKIMRANIRKY
jgi:hypothetical protein